MLDPVVHTVESAPMETKGLLEGAKAKYGFIPNLVAAMAEAPSVLAGYIGLAEAFDQASLTPREQQVVALAVSHFHSCRYCMSGHSMLGVMTGIDSEDLEALREGRPLSDPRLEALRRYTTRVVESRGRIAREEVQAMLDAGFTRQQLMEVNLGVAFKTLSNYTHALVPVEVDGPIAAHSWTPTPDETVHVLVTGWLSPDGKSELGAYQSAAGPIMKRHGGKPVLKSGTPGPMVGDSPNLVVVMQFPSADAARAAFDDPDYQPLIPLRDRVFTRLVVSNLGKGA